MTQIMAIDGGNFETKVISDGRYDCFSSMIGEWRERTVGERHSPQDMEFHIQNQYEDYKGFAGPFAVIESEYGGTIFGATKNHIDAYTRILLGIWRNIKGDKVKIVVGQPYKSHTPEEKEDIITALKNEHSVTVNGVKKTFTIENVIVSVEGAAAFLNNPINGPVNVIDIGSGTVNCIHFLNKKIVDLKSDTLLFGAETSKNGKNLEAMAKGIFGQMSRAWNKNDKTYVCGGIANLIVEPLKKYFPNIEVLEPKFDLFGGKTTLEPKYANAVGMYNLALRIFNND